MIDEHAAGLRDTMRELKKRGVRGFRIHPGTQPVDVWLDAPGVSRRHARIHTSASGEAVLEDSRSTNGTYVRKSRILGPTRLSDGDEIHVGSVVLTFRQAGRSKPTERVRPPQ